MEKKKVKRERLAAAGKLGGAKGGRARAESLPADIRSAQAKEAAEARWANTPSRLLKERTAEHAPLFLIAEIGICHDGDISVALELIRAAASAGFPAVKFQKRTIERVYTKEFLDSPRESRWGTTQRAQKRGLELTLDHYKTIDAECRSLGMAWSASAWDLESQKFLRKFDLPFNKIASPLLTHLALLRDVASEGKHCFISTGMSVIEEIDEAVNIFAQANCPFELMHCVSTYPTPEEHINLLCIPMLRERYGAPVGYSGHEESLIKICCAAVALGASSIERHITLSRTRAGSDHAASIEAYHLKQFVDTMTAIRSALGDGVKRLTPGEDQVKAKLRRFSDVQPDHPS